jgi:hypothetical protein
MADAGDSCGWCCRRMRHCECYTRCDTNVAAAAARSVKTGGDCEYTTYMAAVEGERTEKSSSCCVACSNSVRWKFDDLLLSAKQMNDWWKGRQRDALDFGYAFGQVLCRNCFVQMDGERMERTDTTETNYLPLTKLVDGRRLWLVDGCYGPPWPRGLVGVKEPTPLDNGAILGKRSAPVSSGQQEARKVIVRENENADPDIIKPWTGSTTVHDTGIKKDRGVRRGVAREFGSVVDGTSGYSIPLNSDSDNINGSKKRIFHSSSSNSNSNSSSNDGPKPNLSRYKEAPSVSQSHRCGHRISNGKIIPMALNLTNKTYKKPTQLNLNSFVVDNNKNKR